MRRRSLLGFGLGVCALGGMLLSVSGCDYGSGSRTYEVPAGISQNVMKTSKSARSRAIQSSERQKAILDSVVQLIASASLNPGGSHFDDAIENLNQFFSSYPASDFQLSPQARDYLLPQIGPGGVEALENPEYARPDARHVEDCMTYQGIATRVAGTGDDLTRVRRVFDWMVRNVQLVPVGALAPPGIEQAPVRPFDVLLRGMATEPTGTWDERAWLFMALCRQINIDVGLITYRPFGQADRAPETWACVALIDGTPYLFDTRLGMPIPRADGQGVATLEEALTDPRVLDQLDLPGQMAYETTRARLSGGKLGILIDSSTRYLSPRMRLLQDELRGQNRMVLYRDPAEQRLAFADALGDRLGEVGLWSLPIEVETGLYTNPLFVDATQFSIQFFDPRLPLIYARMAQLRGDLSNAIEQYVNFRFAERPTLRDGETPIPQVVQDMLDVYATYFLALCHLDQDGHTKQSEFLLKEMLRLVPEPAPDRPYVFMFRWGAQTNLGRMYQQTGQPQQAIRHFVQMDPTSQYHGNRLRARGLIWQDPMAPPPEPLPPAPPYTGPDIAPSTVDELPDIDPDVESIDVPLE